MVLDMVLGGAIVGLFTASLLSQASNRAANRTIDLASEEMDRIIRKWRGENLGDPETKAVLRLLDNYDLEAKARIALLLIKQLEDDPNPTIHVCLDAIRSKIKEIEKILIEIKVELVEHRQRWLHEFLFSNARPMLDSLKRKLDSLDRKIDLLVKLKMISLGNQVEETTPLPDNPTSIDDKSIASMVRHKSKFFEAEAAARGE
jgi:hypothetical protein